MRSQSGLFAAGDPDAGKAFALCDWYHRKGPFWHVALVAPPESLTLQRKGGSAPCWLSRGTELSPELVGHLHKLLCWEHSTPLTCTAQAPWVCWHCWHRAALVTHSHGNPQVFGEHGCRGGSPAPPWQAGPGSGQPGGCCSWHSGQPGTVGQMPDSSRILETDLWFCWLGLGLHSRVWLA